MYEDKPPFHWQDRADRTVVLHCRKKLPNDRGDKGFQCLPAAFFVVWDLLDIQLQAQLRSAIAVKAGIDFLDPGQSITACAGRTLLQSRKSQWRYACVFLPFRGKLCTHQLSSQYLSAGDAAEFLCGAVIGEHHCDRRAAKRDRILPHELFWRYLSSVCTSGTAGFCCQILWDIW